MPRKARTRAESGIYHVMLRGINCQQIFESNQGTEVIRTLDSSTFMLAIKNPDLVFK